MDLPRIQLMFKGISLDSVLSKQTYYEVFDLDMVQMQELSLYLLLLTVLYLISRMSVLIKEIATNLHGFVVFFTDVSFSFPFRGEGFFLGGI